MPQPVTPRPARRSRLRDFLHDCAGSRAHQQADLLREAAVLLGAGPGTRDGRVVEAMLSCGAYENAALQLIGETGAFILSRGVNGVCLASVPLPDGSEDVIAEAPTLALALIAAQVSMLLAEDEDAAQPVVLRAPATASVH